jgi:acyl-coenzyme A thioesterase PaaI-like protein
VGSVRPASARRIDKPAYSRACGFRPNGLVHAGAIAAIADSACGYAALSLMDPGAAVLSVEYKVNLLAPGCEAALARPVCCHGVIWGRERARA